MGNSRFAALLLLCLGFANGYMFAPNAPAGWGFSSVHSDMKSPIVAFPYVNSAGLSKLLAVDAVTFPSAPSEVYSLNDMDWQTGALSPETTVLLGYTFAAVGGVVYLTGFTATGNSLFQMDANGDVLKTFQLIIRTAGSIPCVGLGMVVNPYNRHLYISCFNVAPDNVIIDVDPSIFDGAMSGASFTVGVHFSILLESEGSPCSAQLHGLAFSQDYKTLYSVCKDSNLQTNVNGFAIDPIANEILDVIYQSSPYDNGFSVVAGTGCLKDLLFISNTGGFAQLDLNGVQTQILTGGLVSLVLQPDPLDGSLLVPIWSDIVSDPHTGDILRATPPACGGFAGPRRYFAPGVAVGAPCEMASECSTDSCVENTCALSSYLGHCQTDVDCNDPESSPANAFWCLLWRQEEQQGRPHHEEHHEHHGEGEGHEHENRNRRRERLRERFEQVEEPTSDEDFFPARYGVCILNSCSIAAVCDQHATCVPVGDGTHVCRCNEGYYGNGLPGHCASPCAVANGGCAVGAACTSTSPTDVHCACPVNMAGDGYTCFADPCLSADPPCASDPEVHAAFCTATGPGAYECNCGADYWQNGVGCLLNACVTANYCDEHASCTPSGTMDSQATCSCHDGYKNTNMPPPSPTCVAATCIALNPGAFPLNQIDHSIIGTCVGLVTGQTCQVGCGPGFKPKGSTFTTCTPTPGRPTSYYSVPQFECIPVSQKTESGHHHGKDHTPATPPTPSPAPQAWVCPIGQQCHPQAPLQVLPKHSTSIKLHWYPLQTSPNNDVVSALVVSILPLGGTLTTYSNPIDNPSYTNSITISGLTSGQTYTFRLVVTLMGNMAQVAGEPLVVTL